MRTNFLSTFGIATDQGGKLGLGKAKSMICMYENFQVLFERPLYIFHLIEVICFKVIQMNKVPLVVTFVTNSGCNTGHVLALESQLEPLLPVLRAVVGDT